MSSIVGADLLPNSTNPWANPVILVQEELELFVNIGPVSSHGGQTESETSYVLDPFTTHLLHLIEKVFCVNKSQSVETASLCVPGAGECAIFRKI